MLDMVEINNTIEELENGQTTFDSCQKLASLYLIRDHITADEVVEEYNDILPSYNAYVDVKRRYQLSEATEDLVFDKLKLVCSEIIEFLQILYNNTDTQQERLIIENMLSQLVTTKKSAS